jgi:hypothetical protein
VISIAHVLEFIEPIEQAAQAYDVDAFRGGIGAAWQAAQEATPEEQRQALVSLAGLIDRLAVGPAAEVATLAGALVEQGAPDAGPLTGPVFAHYSKVLDGFVDFCAAWHGRTGDPVPTPEDRNPDEVVEMLGGDLADPAFEPLVRNWYFLPAWNRPVLSILGRPEVRAAVPDRAHLIAALTQAQEDNQDLHWIAGLLQIVDNDPLVVLHRETGKGFLLTIDGVSDNFQLHTLLAGALITPGLIPGEAPDPSWLAAATDAPMEAWSGTVTGSFNLVDGNGKWIWNEGRPADIPVVDGRRFIVLDPAPYERSWSSVRQFPHVPGRITLERELTADEAAHWLSLAQTSDNPQG